MNRSFGVAGLIACIALLTYFRFPGHTYLQQDTQIYVPILEHLWDGGTLRHDLLVERPHVAFTLYDELALTLRRLTGSGFREILQGLQIVTRGLGIWGLYLLALTLLEDHVLSLFVAALCSLGAAIDGPAVLTMEYEPSPRAFAIPLVFLAIGLTARRRLLWASVAASAAFVLHPPSTIAFWLVFFFKERGWRLYLPAALGVLLLIAGAAWQPGVSESQSFFAKVTPELERLQRLRASYNWVSMWWGVQWWKHSLLFGVVLAGYWRVRKLGAYVVGLAAAGMVSVPVSYALLEKMKWGLMPQVQPARTLLFVTAMATVLAAVCGCRAAREQRWVEAVPWFFFVFAPPLVWGWWWLAVLLAFASTGAVAWAGTARSRQAGTWALAALAAAIFFAMPVKNYPNLHTADLQNLSAWARSETPRDAVFLFPDMGKHLQPGVFRSEALRAVYVDWKGGGQVNYLPELGEVWWKRWSETMSQLKGFARYRELGIDYVVLTSGGAIGGAVPVFSTGKWKVYSAADKTP